MPYRRWIPAAFLVAAACAPVLQSAPYDPTTSAPLNGLIYYEPALFVLTYRFGALVDDKGNLLGTVDNADLGKRCVSVAQKSELQVLPDFGKPRALLFHQRAFSATKFSAAFDKGLLTAVGTEHTPQAPEYFKAITDATAAVLKPALGTPAPGALGLACNAGPYLAEITRSTMSK